MVAAAHPLAVDAGYEVLKRGGTAMDAAVAVQLVLGLVEPQSAGIGGGGFILHYSAADGRVRTYDGRETAPAAAQADRFTAAFGRPMGFIDAVLSGKSVGAPGLLAVLERTSQPRPDRVGCARRARVPAAPRSPRLRSRWDQWLVRDPFAAPLRPRGPPKAVGGARNPSTPPCSRIAANGAQAFYRGAIAADVAAAVRITRSAAVT
jgi:gamma-glutamyltranspeptidase/glutathione hydrolase